MAEVKKLKKMLEQVNGERNDLILTVSYLTHLLGGKIQFSNKDLAAVKGKNLNLVENEGIIDVTLT